MTGVDAVWDVLELIAAQQGLDADPDDRVLLLLQDGFDPGRLVELAMRHGLLAALAEYLNRHGLRRTFPVRLKSPVMSYLQLSEHRARLLTAEAVRISAGLREAGVRAAWTKGVILQSTLYDDTYVRTYNDVDLMIAPADRDRTREVLISLGYEPNTRYDQAGRQLQKISRASELIYKMSPDHLPHFHRLTGDACVPAVSVDVANSLTWHDSEWQVPMEPVMEQTEMVKVQGTTMLPALSPMHSFLFLCLHLFREGWMHRTIEIKDLSLAQFADIARQWGRLPAQERRAIGQNVAALGLSAPIAWACAHTDALFGTHMVSEMVLQPHADPAWLASAQGGSGRRLVWSGDMRQRLRDPQPVELTVRSA